MPLLIAINRTPFFRIKADFQIITPQTGHILDNQNADLFIFNQSDQFTSRGTVKVRPRIPVVHKKLRIRKMVSFAYLLKIAF